MGDRTSLITFTQIFATATLYDNGTLGREATKTMDTGNFWRVAKSFGPNVFQGSSKRRKVATGTSKHPTTKGKERASDKPTIQIPTRFNDGDVPLSDQDRNLLEEYGETAGFLNTLDYQSIARWEISSWWTRVLKICRSKKESLRLRKLDKPIRQPVRDHLPDVSSHSEDEGGWSSNIGSDDFGGSSSRGNGVKDLSEDSDLEMAYETAPRPRRPSWGETSENEVQRLPIKLLDGRVKNVGAKLLGNREQSSEESDNEEASKRATPEPREDATLGSRLGRRSVVDVITTISRKERIHAAKEQIASICQEIVGDPEDGVRCLHFVRIIIVQSHSFSFRCSAVSVIFV